MFRDILYTLARELARAGEQAFHIGGPVIFQVQLSNHGAAVVHQHSLPDSLQLHPLATQGSADTPADPIGIHLASAVEFQHFAAWLILPPRRMRIIPPRDALPWMDRAWRVRRVDNEPVWSISCFYVRKGHMKKGISRRLLEAAIATARRKRVRLLEAYPIDARLTNTSSYTGYVSTFRRAGFKVVTRRVQTQPIMRLQLNEASSHL